MKSRVRMCLLMAAASQGVWAGGLITNTNQSVSFLRNPARDAAIGVDGVYSNPAGVAFMRDGWHVGLNWQSAWQDRTVVTSNSLFALGEDNGGRVSKRYEGEAKAPVIPSLQAAYNRGRLSLQLNVSVTGGGGKCEFAQGLGSFESAVARIAAGFHQFGDAVYAQTGQRIPTAVGYDADYYMKGSQYYFGFTLGAAYKLDEHLSVYGGLRALYGKANYKARINNIMVDYAQGEFTGRMPFQKYYYAVEPALNQTAAQLEGVVAQCQQAGVAVPAPVAEQLQSVRTLQGTEAFAVNDGINMQSDQTGFGLAPILGVDYKTGAFNFAAKYEFRTRMRMKNESTVKEAMALEAVNQFRDGTKVREDSPALLAVGAQWSVAPAVRVNGGYHHFFDKQSRKYADKQELLKRGTNEYLGGVEVDAMKGLTLSGGFQITRYGLSDEYMSDLSFVTNSWTFGLGARYQVCPKVGVNVAYFQTNYNHYRTSRPDANGSLNDFHRTNKVVGVGVEVDI